MKTNSSILSLLFLVFISQSCSLFDDDDDDENRLSEATFYLEEDCFPGETISVYKISDAQIELVGELTVESDVTCNGTKGLTIPIECESCGLALVGISDDFRYGNFGLSSQIESGGECVNALRCSQFQLPNFLLASSTPPELIEIPAFDLRTATIEITNTHADVGVFFEFGIYFDFVISGSDTQIGTGLRENMSDLYDESPIFYFSITTFGDPLPTGFASSLSMGGSTYLFEENDFGIFRQNGEYKKVYYFRR